VDIKKLREKQNKAGFGRLYKNENGLAAWTYEGMRPVVAAQSKNLNNALAHIDYIVAAANALPEALDEIERLRILKSELTDKADLWRDEFLRIKALTENPEIIGLCDRALTDIEQAVPVVARCETLEKENAHLRQELAHYKQIAELATEGLADAVRGESDA